MCCCVEADEGDFVRSQDRFDARRRCDYVGRAGGQGGEEVDVGIFVEDSELGHAGRCGSSVEWRGSLSSSGRIYRV